MKKPIFFASLIAVLCCAGIASAQDPCLPPSPLKLPDGSVIKTTEQWEKTGRPAWLKMFREQMHGYFPDVDVAVRYEVKDVKKDALDGAATRKQVRAVFSANGMERTLDMIMYIPNKAPLKATFVGLNFWSNYTAFPDPDIPMKDWITGTQSERQYGGKNLEEFRGARVDRWPVRMIIDAGYAVVTAHYGDLYLDVYPDTRAGYEGSVARMLFADGAKTAKVPYESRGQAVATWAWGLSRMLDYVHSDADFATKNAAVIGHSRLGKTSIWAGASDPRFGLVISNNSGSCGAAVARCKTGESVKRTNTVRPHWFSVNMRQYMDNEFNMPFDMNVLLSLVAPRAVYVGSASQDPGAAPEFEYKGIYYAAPVYELYGYKGFDSPAMPGVGEQVWKPQMGFHLREGKHDINPYDWERYLKFADSVFK